MKKMRPVSIKGMGIIDNFINSSYNEGLNPKTLKEYSSDLKHFIGWHEYGCLESNISIREFSFSQVTEEELQAYKESMQKIIELKPATINRRIVSLKLLFEWALDQGYLEKNLAMNIKFITPDKILPKRITSIEEKQLIEAVTKKGSLRDQSIIKIMLNTGLKTGEVARLKYEDVTILKRRGWIYVKDSYGIRKIPLNITCTRIISEYLGSIDKSSTYLFPSEKTGEKLGERALRHIVKKYMKLAGLKDHNALSIRHRFGYTKAADTPLQKLAGIMGHNSINTTSVYLKKND